MEKEVIDLLKRYTGHAAVKLTSRGNEAILDAFKSVKKLNPGKYVLVPDQAGWLTFLNYPKKAGFEVRKLRTDRGVIDLGELRNNVKYAACLIYLNPAGYFAEQPIKEIYEICKQNHCIVILDVSGSVGSSMCDGKYADIIVGSFGDEKPVDLGKGGFISFKSTKDYSIAEEALKPAQLGNDELAVLYDKLAEVGKRYEALFKVTDRIKKDLSAFDIIHRDKKGINVIVAFKDDEEKAKITSYCEKNKYEFTLCPRYIRVNEKAVSIEVKRLNLK